jgi:hypothetical protein
MIAMIDPGSAYPATKEFKLQIDHRRYHMQNVWSGELLSGNVKPHWKKITKVRTSSFQE